MINKKDNLSGAEEYFAIHRREQMELPVWRTSTPGSIVGGRNRKDNVPP
jgi:hypothetical protein